MSKRQLFILFLLYAAQYQYYCKSSIQKYFIADIVFVWSQISIKDALKWCLCWSRCWISHNWLHFSQISLHRANTIFWLWSHTENIMQAKFELTLDLWFKTASKRSYDYMIIFYLRSILQFHTRTITMSYLVTHILPHSLTLTNLALVWYLLHCLS